MKKKILALNGNAVGDVILSTPILKGLKDLFPDSHIAFLVRPECRSLVEGLPFIDEVIPYKKGERVWPVVRKIWRYHMALCLDFKYRSAVLPFLARIPIRAGMRHKRGLFLNHPVDRDPNEANIYETCNFAGIAQRSLGLKIPGDLTQLYIAEALPEEKKRVQQLFCGLHPKRKVIAVAPFSSRANKDWPIAKYSKLIARLQESLPVQVVMLGGAQDREREKIAGALDWVGKTTLTEMSEIFRRADLFIGPCSGPLHIAAASQVPIVALYSSTSPNQWAPKKNTTVIFHQQECCPCDRKPCTCTEFPCVDAIEVNEVFQACLTQLSLDIH